MKRDYYEILGVGRNASQQEIKSAYRKLAVQFHPDRNSGDKAAEEKFKEAAEAYAVLSDREKRERYDRFGHSGVSGSAGGGFDPDIFSDFSDILGDFFGFGDIFGSSRRRSRSRAQRGHDLRYDLTIDFEEAVFGVKAKIKLPRQQTCPDCSGSGADPAHGTAVCSVCGGQGQVRFQQGFFTISRTCSRCNGAGRTIEVPCSNCQGSGRVQKEKVLEIKIPAGVEDQSRLRVAGEGESGIQGGPPGDLYVVISVKPHPFFQRQGRDLYCEIPLTFTQAALGAEIEVPTLEGKQKLKIPPGTQTGELFRFRGQGVTSLLNGGGRGDQLVKVKVVTPTKLSKEEKELFQRLAELSPAPGQSGQGLFEKVKEIFG